MGYDFTLIFDMVSIIYFFIFFQVDMSRMKLKPMTDRAVMVRVGVEILALFLSCIPLIYLYLIRHGKKEPHVRGFFCDDENLKHPYLEEQISVHACAGVWVFAVLFLVILVELVTNYVYEFPQWKQSLQQRGAIRTARLPRILIETYRYVLGLVYIYSIFH